MKCPRDGRKLKSVRYEADVKLDRCPACGGVYLDAGELEKVEEEFAEHDYTIELTSPPEEVRNAYDMARHRLDPVISCPRCGDQMARREYAYCSQILIDVCPNDEGIWLERGELEAIERFFDESRLTTSGLRRRFLHGLKEFFFPSPPPTA